MNLSTKLLIGFLTISLLFAIVAIINFRLSEAVISNSQYLDRSQTIIRNSTRLERNIIDMENGFRGYLLTGEEAFLAHYKVAYQQIPFQVNELKGLLQDTPEQLAQLETINTIHSRWHQSYASSLIAEKAADTLGQRGSIQNLPSGHLFLQGYGKQKTDSIRILFRNFHTIEYAIRADQNDKLEDSIRQTRWLSSSLTVFSILLGLIWTWYITRFFSRRIKTMVGLADKISRGDYKIQILDNKQDELSKLSFSLNLMARTIDSTFSELDRKNKELDQFAYVVSHDLKAPLRGIDNASKWVEEDLGKEMPPYVQQYLQMMRVRVKRMENLINGILALARIGRTLQAEEKVDLLQLIRETIDLLSPPKGFIIEIPEYLPVIRAVRVELQQVFSNLISNAIKYHHRPEGRIRILYHDTPDFHVFSVADDGPGIHPDYHARIFVIFQTLQERDAVESTGVGLAIVKKIVERQGGTISVSSQPGEGATFTFSWPKSRQEELPTDEDTINTSALPA
jgi:signal transduction histidine kinase